MSKFVFQEIDTSSCVSTSLETANSATCGIVSEFKFLEITSSGCAFWEFWFSDDTSLELVSWIMTSFDRVLSVKL